VEISSPTKVPLLEVVERQHRFVFITRTNRGNKYYLVNEKFRVLKRDSLQKIWILKNRCFGLTPELPLFVEIRGGLDCKPTPSCPWSDALLMEFFSQRVDEDFLACIPVYPLAKLCMVANTRLTDKVQIVFKNAFVSMKLRDAMAVYDRVEMQHGFYKQVPWDPDK
jgi:hypothetical protein